MVKKEHILVIDDDREINHLIKDYLVAHNYKVTSLYNGLNLTRMLSEHTFDLVILDIMLPGKDGLTLCKELRQYGDIPVIMLSAAQTEADRVAGLELGADDYMAKPFGSRELLARIKALLRRTTGQLASQDKKLKPLDKLKFDQWLLDRETHSLIGNENVILALSQREYDLLILFLSNPNRILSRAKLVDLLYEKELDPMDRSIDVLIGRLRKKIELDPKSPAILKTVRGGGYQLTCSVEVINV